MYCGDTICCIFAVIILQSLFTNLRLMVFLVNLSFKKEKFRILSQSSIFTTTFSIIR